MAKSEKPRRRRWLAVIGVGVIGVLAFVLLYFEPQTAFIDDEVSETLPGLDVALASSPSVITTAAPTAFATNSIGTALATASETGSPVVLSTGTFISGEHDTSGT